ncbi:XdhC family protein [Alkalicoccobacillus porphyridii]|uniref:XdhC family protein n=1 Tax=Alkalicoccobacillus porphyridii TaxID=2597270 RepID=A0A554A3P3_9BACI|nr:XdhC/CoxI family protein [Alkalicoccobacillus porphyridii]TSB48314.1 XdhC family protein [Alkalicoccobacillus porphyridii]
MDDFYTILDVLERIDYPATLATIVQVDGSAYKKEGASMVIQHDGERFGILSAGCLEEDLTARVLQGETARKLTYDMSEEGDFSYGAGAGCNGTIHVLLERLDEQYVQDLRKVKECLDRGQSVLIVKQITSVGHLFLLDSGEVLASKPSIATSDITKLAQCFHDPLILKGINTSDFIEPIYVQRVLPKPRLIVFGAGEDARPLVSMAAKIGFEVWVSDWRPALCNNERFPSAKKLVQGFPAELIQLLSINSTDSIVVMSHHFHHDQTFIQRLKQKNIRYLGILGSSKRTARLFHGMGVPDFVCSPAGLSINAQGAEEIAVSIIAQLIQIHRTIPQAKQVLAQ